MQKKLPGTGEIWFDKRGNRFQMIGRARNWKTMEEVVVLRIEEGEEYYTVSSDEFSKEFEPAEGSGQVPLLPAFLDASSDEEKLVLLQKRREEIGEEFLDAAAQSMDFVRSGRDLESDLLEFENYLRTKIRYERKRI